VCFGLRNWYLVEVELVVTGVAIDLVSVSTFVGSAFLRTIAARA
jgi:hypothetical protein